MATAAQISVEEYLRTSYEPNCEYIDGVLRPKATGTKKHSRLQIRLGALPEQLGYEAGSELTVQVRPGKYLIPDVAADKHIADPYPDRPFLLCVEILSPGDRPGSTLAKCEDYHAWGVPDCWVLDPDRELAWEYHRGGIPDQRPIGQSIRAGEIEIPVADLFASL
jgi:Uma2 family endonuclease